MRRIRIVSRARKNLGIARAHRKDEAMNLAFARSLRKGGDFFGSMKFASDAADSRRLARYYAKEARKSLFPGYTTAKRIVRKAKTKGKKLLRRAARK